MANAERNSYPWSCVKLPCFCLMFHCCCCCWWWWWWCCCCCCWWWWWCCCCCSGRSSSLCGQMKARFSKYDATSSRDTRRRYWQKHRDEVLLRLIKWAASVAVAFGRATPRLQWRVVATIRCCSSFSKGDRDYGCFRSLFFFFFYSPILGVSVFVWLARFILWRFVFRNKEFPDLSININNRYSGAASTTPSISSVK